MGQQDMRTPKWLFDLLNELYGPFQLDAFADHHNALCKRYYTEQGDDGLIAPWLDRTFANPPFSIFDRAMCKAVTSNLAHGHRSVLIGPVACSQRWFHDWVVPNGHILVPNKRINFLRPDGTPTKSADRDTMIFLVGYREPWATRLLVEPLDVRAVIPTDPL
jgi:phage N-6-adenine-methyltransferase